MITEVIHLNDYFPRVAARGNDPTLTAYIPDGTGGGPLSLFAPAVDIRLSPIGKASRWRWRLRHEGIMRLC